MRLLCVLSLAWGLPATTAWALPTRVIDCPCIDQASIETGAAPETELRVHCTGAEVHIELQFGAAHRLERSLPYSPENCRAVPELIRLLRNGAKVERTPAPTRSPKTNEPRAPPTKSALVVRQSTDPDPTPPPISSPSLEPREPEPPAEAQVLPVVVEPPPAPPPLNVSAPSVLAFDVAAEFVSSPTVASFSARLAWAPFTHAGFSLSGGTSLAASHAFDTQVVDSTAAHLELGAVFSLRAFESWGPRVDVTVGAERVEAHGRTVTLPTDAGWGLRGTVALEWNQPIISSLYVRPWVALSMRPAPWSVRLGPSTELLWPPFSLVAGVGLGGAWSIFEGK